MFRWPLNVGTGRPVALSLVAAACLVLVSVSISWGVELRPLSLYNLMPQKQLFGLTRLEGGELVRAGGWRLSTTLSQANTYASEEPVLGGRGEQLLLDGETTRVGLTLRYGFSSRLELGGEIPLVGQSGGFLDSFIEDFHDLFGFPPGDRVNDQRNRLEFSYREGRGQEPRFELHDADFGLGDIRLAAALALLRAADDNGRDLALRLELKLPTGESDQWRGSGAMDVSARLALTQHVEVGSYPLRLFLTGGLLYLGDGDLLPEKQQSLVGLTHVGLALGVTDDLALNLQFDGHSKLFSGSDLREWSDFALQVDLGGRYQINPRTSLDIGIGEDISVHTAPDVTFHLALNFNY